MKSLVGGLIMKFVVEIGKNATYKVSAFNEDEARKIVYQMFGIQR